MSKSVESSLPWMYLAKIFIKIYCDEMLSLLITLRIDSRELNKDLEVDGDGDVVPIRHLIYTEFYWCWLYRIAIIFKAYVA